jgi:hypothetical protein
MSNWLNIWKHDHKGDPSMGRAHAALKNDTFPPREAQLFQEKHNTSLYLLEGDFEDTKENRRDVNYGTVESFKFYNKVSDLKEWWDSQKLDYTFVDANNIRLDDSLKFDLIYSSVSCGFHYPASTYKDLISKHSHKNTKIIFDIRKKSEQHDIKIIKVIAETKKYVTAEIQFIQR